MKSSFLGAIRALVVWAAFVVPAMAQPAGAPEEAPVSVSPASDANLQDYLIGPHDLLEVTVFQVEDLSRTVRVNARGSFSLPMIGQVVAAGLTAGAVETIISDKLRECCLQDPQVTIFIKEFVSQRVTVEGEVAKPGVYAISGRTTLLQAIAMAAGAGQLAELNEVRIFRSQADGMKETLSFNLEAIRSGTQADPVIQGNDVVVVGKSGSLAVIKGITDTLRGFIGFGTVR
jgi:polysaccharide export outer membrane protein